jgi:hypothetical protein
LAHRRKGKPDHRQQRGDDLFLFIWTRPAGMAAGIFQKKEI